MFYKWGEVISDQFEHLEVAVAFSHIFNSIYHQIFSVFLKTKNVPSGPKCKLNQSFLLPNRGFPKWGVGGVGKFPYFIVFLNGERPLFSSSFG